VDDHKELAKQVISRKSSEDLRESLDWLKTLLEYRALGKLYDTYIKGIRTAAEKNEESRIYCNYNLDGTKTGRLSCSSYGAKRSMGVSFHTLPREDKHNIRSLFPAPEGYAFIAGDYSTMELRVLAHLSREPGMKEAFRNKEDLHTYTASLLFAKPKEKITKHERQIAKSVSFLIVYGGGAFRLAEMTAISQQRAQKIIDRYNEVFPHISRFETHVHNFIRQNKYAYSIFNRRRNLLDVDSRDPKVKKQALRQGLNFTVQSSASDILCCAFKGLSERLPAGAHLFATVHDSIEIITPLVDVEEVLTIMYDEMVNTPTLKKDWGLEFDIPFEVDLEVGPSFGVLKGVEMEDGRPTNTKELLEFVTNHQKSSVES
jgi:DNA polymerase-1